MDKDSLINKIVFNKYKIIKKIGEGSFGHIYLCICISTDEHFALKIEPKSEGNNLLEFEACILCYLKGYGIPLAKSYGLSGNNHVLVMQLLGKSLEEHFKDNGYKFSLKTVCMMAEQMLDRVEFIHNNHIIHRDIKPDNFMTGEENRSLIYLIDFGLAMKFRSSKTLEHNPIKDNKKLTGTARYASINAILGLEQSRRDDLESIGYVLVYFLKGCLPWQGLKVLKEENRYTKIYEKKKNTSPEALCEGLPEQFVEYVRYTRGLKYEQDPDYDYLRLLFKRVMEDFGWENDFKFDWIKEKDKDILSTNIPSQRNNNLNILDTNIHKKESLRKEKGLMKKDSNLELIPTVENHNETHVHQGRPELRTKLSILQAKEKELNINNIREIETDEKDKIKQKKKSTGCCFS